MSLFKDSLRKSPVIIEGFWEFMNNPVGSGLDFTGTAIAAGTFAISATLAGGRAVLSGAATTDDSGYQIQQTAFPTRLRAKGIVTNSILIKPSAAAAPWFFGSAVSDISLIASAPSSCIGLNKDKTTSVVNLLIRTGGTQVLNQSLGAIANAADEEAVWTLRTELENNPAEGRVIVAKNAIEVYRSDLLTNLPITVALGLSFAFQSGSATGTQTCEVDWTGFRSAR